MSIKEDSKSRFDTEYGSGFGWRVYCDVCGKANHKAGCDAGEAADHARKEGFTTKPNGSKPSKWVCPEHK